MAFVSEAQREALYRNGQAYNQARAKGEIVQRRTRTTKKQIAASKKNLKDQLKHQKVMAMKTEAKVVKAYLESDSVEQVAKKTDISVGHASAVLSQMRKNGTLREAFSELGWDAEGLAKEVVDFKKYNSDKVIRVVGEGINSREVEEMRDASNSFKAMKLASDHISATANALASSQNSIDVDRSTALLAIKSLIQKLDEDSLRVVRDSIDVLLEKSLRVVEN